MAFAFRIAPALYIAATGAKHLKGAIKIHLRPREKLAAQRNTEVRPVTMRGLSHTLVTKRPHDQID
jgi:hypothetical protein